MTGGFGHAHKVIVGGPTSTPPGQTKTGWKTSECEEAASDYFVTSSGLG